MCWPEAELERALAGGAHRRELAAYLGRAEYPTLSALAREAQAVARGRRTRRGRLKVYLLPGILGSQLGRLRAAGEPPDLLWIDPDDIVNGRLTELRLPRITPGSLRRPRGDSRSRCSRWAPSSTATWRSSCGWRPPALTSCSTTTTGAAMCSRSGQALTLRLAADAAGQLALVGHSMGGTAGACSAGALWQRARRRAHHPADRHRRAARRLDRGRAGAARHLPDRRPAGRDGSRARRRHAHPTGVSRLHEPLSAVAGARHGARPVRS